MANLVVERCHMLGSLFVFCCAFVVVQREWNVPGGLTRGLTSNVQCCVRCIPLDDSVACGAL